MIWVVAAVEAELKILLSELDAEFTGFCGDYAHYVAEIRGQRVRLGVLGIGVASASLALGAFISLEMPERAVMTGTAGSLPGSGLELGDLVTAREETMAELGLIKGPGIGDVQPLKLADLPQRIGFDPGVTECLAEAAAVPGSSHQGGLLTVAGVSPDHESAKSRADRFQVVAENMEGYALALAGQRFGIKAGEVRGISNEAGDSDKSRWDFRGAETRAQHAVLRYLRRMGSG